MCWQTLGVCKHLQREIRGEHEPTQHLSNLQLTQLCPCASGRQVSYKGWSWCLHLFPAFLNPEAPTSGIDPLTNTARRALFGRHTPVVVVML